MTISSPVEEVTTKVLLTEPSLFKLIYIDDNETTMQFVVGSLISHFSYSEEISYGIMEKIHTDGSAVAAELPYQIAEQKCVEISIDAKQNGFPLQVKLEKVN